MRYLLALLALAAVVVLVVATATRDDGPLTPWSIATDLQGRGLTVAPVGQEYALGPARALDVAIEDAAGNIYVFPDHRTRDAWHELYASDTTNVAVLGPGPWALALGDQDKALAARITAALGQES
jgi:hypothetical protein